MTTVDYPKNFDPKWYTDTYYSCISGQEEEEGLLEFNIDGYHEIFVQGDVKGRVLLDVGTGPTIHSIISASRHVDEIYLSDFASQNRDVLTNWWKGKNTAQDQVTKYILKKEKATESVEDRQSMMKLKVKGVLPIDVTLQRPLGEQCEIEQFDIITSSLCLETPCRSLDDYRHSVQNMSTLLKVGGHLVLNGVLEQTFYRVGQFKFECLSLTRNQIETVYDECGYKIMKFYEMKMENERETDFSDFRGAFVMHAMKVK